MGLGFLVRVKMKVKSWVGVFPEATSACPSQKRTTACPSQKEGWLLRVLLRTKSLAFTAFSFIGKTGMGNLYINEIWDWYERKLLLGNNSSALVPIAQLW